ncbi:MAG: formate dehydrogenase [Rhodospirillaceae bacterium]|nr:formate dehydrogenase [Rhodospirillaceae bacterium]|tara:strand:+ start:256 stop:462 length:207 start_codon:yes stop_codon:yes gene_type:complete
MNTQKLIYMANQISNYFESYPEEKAIISTTNHINKYWDKRMKKEIIVYAENNGDGLNSVALNAVNNLK